MGIESRETPPCNKPNMQLKTILNQVIKHDFNKSIEDIQSYVSNLERENTKLRDRLSEYNKDVDIIKLRNEADIARALSLLQLSPKESVDIKQFKKDHYKSCENSGDFEYRITGTGLGSVIKIKCPKCMTVKDVTDATTW